MTRTPSTLETRLAETRADLASTTNRERVDRIGWTPSVIADKLGVSTDTARNMVREHRPDDRVDDWLLTLAALHVLFSKPDGWE